MFKTSEDRWRDRSLRLAFGDDIGYDAAKNALKQRYGVGKIVKGPSFTKKETDIGARTMNEEISKTYSLDEIAKHNNRDDLWIIVKGKVYDVTTYLPVHQGGDAILKWAGKDATKGVYGPQHPTTVPKLLERYYIGDVM